MKAYFGKGPKQPKQYAR